MFKWSVDVLGQGAESRCGSSNFHGSTWAPPHIPSPQGPTPPCPTTPLTPPLHSTPHITQHSAPTHACHSQPLSAQGTGPRAPRALAPLTSRQGPSRPSAAWLEVQLPFLSLRGAPWPSSLMTRLLAPTVAPMWSSLALRRPQQGSSQSTRCPGRRRHRHRGPSQGHRGHRQTRTTLRPSVTTGRSVEETGPLRRSHSKPLRLAHKLWLSGSSGAGLAVRPCGPLSLRSGTTWSIGRGRSSSCRQGSRPCQAPRGQNLTP